jgi:DNA repair exonuclease SbcCD ATPase subunit
LEYDLEDGRRYEVRRDFATADVITQLLDQGLDVSSEFGRGRHGNVPFARRHLGMPRSVFESCAFISQGDVFEVAKNAPTEIGDAVAALADSGRRDVSAALAMDRLDAALKKIGSDQARTAELPKARVNLARARNELAATDEARRAVAEKAERLDRLQAKVRQLTDERARAEYALHRARAARIRAKMAEIETAEKAVTAAAARRGTTKPAPVTSTMRDEVLSLRGQLQRANDALKRLDADRAATVVTPEERLEYETLRLSAGKLAAEQVSELEGIAYAAEAPVAATGFIAVLAAIGRAIMGAARAVVRFVLRRRREAFAPEPAPSIVASREEAVALLERHRRYLTLRPQVERADSLERQIEAERQGIAAAETRLVAVMQEAGLRAHTPGEAFGAFDVAWKAKLSFEKTEQEFATAIERRDLLLSGRTVDELRSALAEHEVAAEHVADGRLALAGAEPKQVPEQIERALTKLREQEHEAELSARTLGEEVRLALEGYRPRAEIEEEVAHWEREVARLEKARAALTLARQTIGEAMASVYRDFAPAVNSFLSEGLAAATDGRYDRAHVDPASLKVSLLVPETGMLVTDPPVSHGTRTLLYFLMRVGLAQHMSTIGEPVPLVLDDPFVDVDSRRLRRMMDFLLGLTEKVQILYFTKDREVLEWFEGAANGPDHRIHHMSAVVNV